LDRFSTKRQVHHLLFRHFDLSQRLRLTFCDGSRTPSRKFRRFAKDPGATPLTKESPGVGTRVPRFVWPAGTASWHRRGRRSVEHGAPKRRATTAVSAEA